MNNLELKTAGKQGKSFYTEGLDKIELRCVIGEVPEIYYCKDITFHNVNVILFQCYLIQGYFKKNILK